VVERLVARDREQPHGEAPARVAPVQALEDLHEHILGEVLRPAGIADQVAKEGLHARSVPRDDDIESVWPPRDHGGEDLLVSGPPRGGGR
jgi:hypothetical protein